MSGFCLIVERVNNVNEWFLFNVGLQQGCVMSPWLFNAKYGWCGSREEY